MQARFDLYDFIHKGIRHVMQGVLVRLGQMDLSDPADVKHTLDSLEELFLGLEQHLVNEEVIHLAVQEQEPGHLVGTLRDEHDDHLCAIAALRSDASAFARATGEPALARRARARHLYLSVSRFVGENLLHMSLEETDMNATLWRLFDDAALVGLWGKIMSKETPQQLARGVRWILPAVSPEERTQIILGARMTMSPAAFEQLLPLVRSVIPADEVASLNASLG